MKITSVCPYFYGGGAEIMWSKIANHTKENFDFEHIVSLYQRKFDKSFLKEFSLPVKIVESDEFLSDIVSDIVVCWGPVKLLKKPKSNWIFFAHSEVSVNSLNIIRDYCFLTWSVSDFLKKNVCSGKNSLIIPVGVDESKLKNGKSLREQLGFSDNDIIVGFVGHFTKNKNYDKVIDSMNLLPNHFKCLMVGKGDYIVQNDRVKCIYLKNENIASAYLTFDYMVLPSIYEGLPQVMWECMEKKIPFMTTACGSQVDFIKHDINAIKIKPSAESIAKECLRLSKNKKLRSYITHNAYLMYLKNGTFDSTIESFKRAVKISCNMKVF